jgi:nucleotide-binding universal stress UspA family protein
MKVLMAIDGSDCSRQAVEFVRDRPWTAEDEILVLHVVEPIPVDMGLAYIPAAYNQNDSESMARAEDLVNKVISILKEKLTQKIEGKVAFGNVTTELIDLAEKWSCDLIVVGSHGRKGFNRLLLGSVAEEILRKAPCSVEIVKGKGK